MFDKAQLPEFKKGLVINLQEKQQSFYAKTQTQSLQYDPLLILPLSPQPTTYPPSYPPIFSSPLLNLPD